MSKTPRVLIVDDSKHEVARFQAMLSEQNIQYKAVNNGEAGIVTSKTYLPDIILMDVVMGGMNGFQATRAITTHETTKHIPVIIVTTKDQTTDRVWAKRQGASAYLVKPVDPQELIETIFDLLNSTTLNKL